MKRKLPVPIDGVKLVVESSVPMPRARKVRSFPWAQMKVGDSFFVPCVDSDDVRSAQVCCIASAKNVGVKSVTKRETGPGGELGVRAWRTA